MADLESIIKRRVLDATSEVETQLDAELERLNHLDLDDLKSIREKRLKELKKQEQERKEWLSHGHGEYTELGDEREFFDISKKSQNVVIVFYKSGSPICVLLDRYIKILCTKHLETKFVKINVERAPFLIDRLGIRINPTVAIVKDGKTIDYINGFAKPGNFDDLSKEMLEWRIAQSKVIRYTGDLRTPPDKQKKVKRPVFKEKRKTIRGSNEKDSSDDEFCND